MEYKQTSISFIELNAQIAKKYVQFDYCYWLREYTILMYLYNYNNPNIIKYLYCRYTIKNNSKNLKNKFYHELTLPKYPYTLPELNIRSDMHILQILVDIFSALSLCHHLNIWHRDIKADNILLDSKFRAILIDFTHSIRIRTNDIVLEENVATITHRAPEIFLYQQDKIIEYNEKIDIWAVGIILYDMVTNNEMYKLVLNNLDYTEFDNFFNHPKYPSIKYKNLLKSDMHSITYIEVLQYYYYRNAQHLLYTNNYWKWITQMLSYNPNDRPSAYQMLELILDFAYTHHISIQTPQWYNHNITKHLQLYDQIDLSLTHRETQIYYKSMSWIIKYHDIIFDYNIDKMASIIKFLIKKQTINKNNIITMTLAISIIINTVIYDTIYTIPTILDQIDKKLKTSICLKQLYTDIVDIMQRHDVDLFLYPKFHF